MNMTPRKDEIELGRQYEQPVGRFGAEHSIPVSYIQEVPDFTAPASTYEDEREVFAPTTAFELSPDIYDKDELTKIINDSARHDAESDIEKYLQPGELFQRASDVFDIYVSDTAYSREEAIAEYFSAFTDHLLDPEIDVSEEQIIHMFNGFEALLEDEAKQKSE